MLNDDTVEIIKRHETKLPWFWTWGADQTGVYERVIIDRSKLSVAVDRMDANYWIPEPFLGQRDLFYVENADQKAAAEHKKVSGGWGKLRDTAFRQVNRRAVRTVDMTEPVVVTPDAE